MVDAWLVVSADICDWLSAMICMVLRAATLERLKPLMPVVLRAAIWSVVRAANCRVEIAEICFDVRAAIRVVDKLASWGSLSSLTAVYERAAICV